MKSKKVRGWKRRVKQIEGWYLLYRHVNFKYFHQHLSDYVKIRIHPWNSLDNTKPPHWYFELIFKKLIDIFFEWHQKYQEIQTPYDLQIWLYEPDVIRSQIVCSKVANYDEKREDYFRSSSDSKKFQFKKWPSLTIILQQFDWQLYDDEEFHFKNIENLNSEEIQDLLDDGFFQEELKVNGEPELRFSKKVGYVWIGRLRLDKSHRSHRFAIGAQTE